MTAISAAASLVETQPPRGQAPLTPMTNTLPIGRPRILMNGDRLDIQASVDLAGLKQLQSMLKKYEEILVMMRAGER